MRPVRPGPKTIMKNTNSTLNKSQTQRARAYEATSFLSTAIHARDFFIVLAPGLEIFLLAISGRLIQEKGTMLLEMRPTIL